WQQDLAPYRALRRALPFVMVAHAAYPEAISDDLPASLSPGWTKILRKRIGYRGLVISDDLEMAGALANGSVAEAAVATLPAGSDMFLVSHREEMVRASYEAVIRAAEEDRDFARHISQSAGRVRAFKTRHSELKRFPSTPTPAKIERLREQMDQFAEGLK